MFTKQFRTAAGDQYCYSKYGAARRVAMADSASHRDVSVTRRGTAPMGLILNLADTKIATSYGGIIIPHYLLSAAKISIIFETSKFSGNYFALAFADAM